MSSETRPARIGFLLSQLGAHAADLFAQEIEPLGITVSEAGVIRILAREPGMTQRELATRLGSTQSRVVAIIDGLEHKQLASRTRSERDRRLQHLDLTQTGRALLPHLRSAARAQELALTRRLSQQQRDDLYGLLGLLSQGHGLDTDAHPGYRSSSG